MSSPYSPETFLDLQHSEHRMLFESSVNVWDALSQISSYLQFRLKPGIHGRLIGKPFISGAVFIGAGTVVEQGAMIKGPAWIGEGCEIRNGAYIRENVIVLNPGSIIGRNAIMYPGTQWRGVLGANCTVKTTQSQQIIAREL
ncbi:MAG: hypothetical protein EBS01_11560 [Verrucomicrobia bacterium]|nr:hypothetical protein [Verrucomicrobiota bacterium]